MALSHISGSNTATEYVLLQKGRQTGVPHFTEDSLQRIIINPFYAITVAALLTEEHEPAVGEAEWVRVNATLLEAMGGEQWLR